MRHRILIVGDELKMNKPMLNYIYESYESHFGELGDISFVTKSNTEFLFVVENLIEGYDSLCIFADDENYGIMARNLATLSGDVLEINDNQTLVAKNAISVNQGSFLIKLNETFINLITANSGQKLPEILVKNDDEVSEFFIFDTDTKSVKILLKPLANPYKVGVSISEILPNLSAIKVVAWQFGSVSGFKKSVKNLFSNKMIDDKNLIKFIADKMIQNGVKITFAESCSAGLCAASIAKFSGISEIFDGSLVTYANAIKHEWLGVSDKILSEFGAVSKECVEAMTQGALRSSYADFAIAVSGIAGPNGGSDEKPVGLVYVSILHKSGESLTQKLMLNGDRNYIREQSVLSAFLLILKLKPELFFS
ncbi:CinA family protein [Campylobacter gastrosuis]|uniref:CinA family protein n=1 Tax=Campylobacter gastrosuis TaxID=2974576 RepID=A0ABT7HQ21_9BACT|nr:CinA family protein [Campylobacter gastrosuis]MDL0088817.1 CinA family protein [Campylobacter gastrosuis]